MLSKYPNTYIISDEIYEHICFDTKHFSIGRVKKIKDSVEVGTIVKCKITEINKDILFGHLI